MHGVFQAGGFRRREIQVREGCDGLFGGGCLGEGFVCAWGVPAYAVQNHGGNCSYPK